MKCCVPLAPLGTADLGGGKGLVLHRTGLVYSRICQKMCSLPWVPQTSVAVTSLRCFHYLYSCFNYAVKWPEMMHREHACVCMRVCVEIFSKTDCSAWVGLPEWAEWAVLRRCLSWRFAHHILHLNGYNGLAFSMCVCMMWGVEGFIFGL